MLAVGIAFGGLLFSQTPVLNFLIRVGTFQNASEVSPDIGRRFDDHAPSGSVDAHLLVELVQLFEREALQEGTSYAPGLDLEIQKST